MGRENQDISDWLAEEFKRTGALEDGSGWGAFVESIRSRFKNERLEGFRAARKAFKASKKQNPPEDAQEAPGTTEPDPGTSAPPLPETGPESPTAVASFHAGSGMPLWATPEPNSPMEAMIRQSEDRVARGEPTRRTKPTTRAAVPPGHVPPEGESE
jgi:hypothetical protein